MPAIAPIVPGIPGVRSAQTATARVVFRQIDLMGGLAQGRLIDGTLAADPDNTGDIDRLRAGLLMGKVTSSGLYANSIIGVTSVAYTSGGTSLTVTTQCATEIVRRIGSSGTFNLTGPPSANGTNATYSVTFSAVNTGTGVVTVSDIGHNMVAGSLVQPDDGSGTIMTLIPDGFPVMVSDASGTRITVQFPQVPVSGIIVSANIINWPSDTSIQAYIRNALRAATAGLFVFDDGY